MARKQEDRAEIIKVKPLDEEAMGRFRQALKDFNPLERMPEPQISKNCCPHCWLRMPLGANYA